MRHYYAIDYHSARRLWLLPYHNLHRHNRDHCTFSRALINGWSARSPEHAGDEDFWYELNVVREKRDAQIPRIIQTLYSDNWGMLCQGNKDLPLFLQGLLFLQVLQDSIRVDQTEIVTEVNQQGRSKE